MIKPDFMRSQTEYTDQDIDRLHMELEEAQKTIRELTRKLSKEQQKNAEAARAYNLTVANLVETTRENTLLSRELDELRARTNRESRPFTFGGHTLELTPTEISAIRKAMARLHHPDVGGDINRMKMWNAALDPLEET